MTSTTRLVGIVWLLLAVAAPARAQRWGGGAGVSRPAAPRAPIAQRSTILVAPTAPIARRGPVLVAPPAPLENRRTVPTAFGGSWDGQRPTMGGSPPARPADPGPDYTAFFGYVPPRGQIIWPRAAGTDSTPVQRALQARRVRR